MVLEHLRTLCLDYISEHWTFAQVSQDAIIPHYNQQNYYYHCKACKINTSQQIWFNSNTLLDSWYWGPIYCEKPKLSNKIYIPEIGSMIFGEFELDEQFFYQNSKKRFRFTSWSCDNKMYLAYQLLKKGSATGQDLEKLHRNQTKGQDDLYALVDYILNENTNWDHLQTSFTSVEFIRKLNKLFRAKKRDCHDEVKEDEFNLYDYIINSIYF